MFQLIHFQHAQTILSTSLRDNRFKALIIVNFSLFIFLLIGTLPSEIIHSPFSAHYLGRFSGDIRLPRVPLRSTRGYSRITPSGFNTGFAHLSVAQFSQSILRLFGFAQGSVLSSHIHLQCSNSPVSFPHFHISTFSNFHIRTSSYFPIFI